MNENGSFLSFTQLFLPSGINMQNAINAYELVLNYAGAIIPKRDYVDQRIIKSIKKSTGQLVNSQYNVGGWPVFDLGNPPEDTDHDGIPDEWELNHSLNPNDSSDSKNDRNGDGYSNLEEYLNELIPSHFYKHEKYIKSEFN